MNLILFLGTKFWGLGAFKIIFVILLSLAIFLSFVVLIFYNNSDKKIVIVDLVVYFLFLIIMICLGIPIKAIIWTFPFIHIFFIVFLFYHSILSINVICYLIGDLIGFTLFYKFIF